MRPFGYLLSSTALSNLADGVLKVGAPLLAVSITRSPTEVALVGVAATLPWMLFALPAGAIADRLDRRTIMVVANAARTVILLAAGTLAAYDLLGLWPMLAAVLLSSVCEVFADLSAQSVLPMAVPSGEIVRANGRVQTVQMIGNEFLGSPIAGVLVVVLPAAVFGASGLLYGVAGLLLLGMRGRFRTPAPAVARSLRADIGEAMRYLWGHRFLRTMAISAGMLNLANTAYFAVFVLWVVGPGSRMGLEPAAYGLVTTALGVGAIAGSLLSERISARFGEGRTLIGAWLLDALLLLVPLLLPVPWALYPTAVLLGLFGAAGNVLVVSTRQRLIPAELMGRVNSAYRLIGTCGMPVGAALGGVLGEWAGLPTVFLAAVVVCLAAVWLLWRVLRDRISAPLTSNTMISDISRSR
ncbi:MFS transporter [Nonomuraea sp. NBC_01738]|uniref:MFS transporter n=1 Tax=Nonomuraea sp. NBC_01738 TaxID=2976003 RepID=UPI002E168151|nr:MFS transporter [Nonomuraea sp. NBC_01738]